MAKIFAVTIILIAIGSAIPIVMHTWHLPAGHFHSRSVDRRAVLGHHGGSGHFLSGVANPAGILHLEILQRQAGHENEELSRRGDGFGDRGVPAGGDRSSSAGCVRSESLGQRLFHSAGGECNAGPGAGGTVRLLFPLSRSGRQVRATASRPDQRSERQLLRARSQLTTRIPRTTSLPPRWRFP